jgi:hypothetical protein
VAPPSHAISPLVYLQQPSREHPPRSNCGLKCPGTCSLFRNFHVAEGSEKLGPPEIATPATLRTGNDELCPRLIAAPPYSSDMYSFKDRYPLHQTLAPLDNSDETPPSRALGIADRELRCIIVPSLFEGRQYLVPLGRSYIISLIYNSIGGSFKPG